MRADGAMEFGDGGRRVRPRWQAIRAGLRQEEGWGPATALRDALIKNGAPSMNDKVHRFYTAGN